MAPATQVSVDGPGRIVYAFGVGLANFGAGRSRLPRQIAADVADVLPLIAWYGATGNLALAAGERVDVAQRLAEITGTAWAVIPARDLAAALSALEAQPTPRVPAGIRPTPGLAFAVEPARPGLIRSIPEVAALRRLNDQIVLVHKFDVLAGNRLDRARRRGGWGHVSAAVARQVGGRWTARSRRPLAGLQALAECCLWQGDRTWLHSMTPYVVMPIPPIVAMISVAGTADLTALNPSPIGYR